MMEQKLQIEAAVENLPQVLSFIEHSLETMHCSPKTKMQINVSVEEIFVNIAHYAYSSNNNGSVTVNTECSSDPPEITITFTDSGVPYDPLAKDDPDITLSAHERNIGGLGIFLVKKMMDQVCYEHHDGQNILKITKKLPSV